MGCDQRGRTGAMRMPCMRSAAARKQTSVRVPKVAPKANENTPSVCPAATSSAIEISGVITGTPAAAANFSFEFRIARQVMLMPLNGITGVMDRNSIRVRRAFSALNPDPRRCTIMPDASAATTATVTNIVSAAMRMLEYNW